ncbi:hypothetical protein B1748_19645 [Paenibacillus sp. MY03]|uniref:L-arabinose isomerase family protein n=1 Tax=Paenibacillus sp. MY03 TaxID=302980 RepID=UPI000B3C013B|nr:hypothetical protein [Paenibacillus sp. MY03]OUS74995.1 hypothetical protein B1748_19645 [Paenibacillus sp. MY03]
MGKLKIGLLPLYVKLYDDIWPEARERVDAFYLTIAGELEKRGLEVEQAKACRISPEFAEAVRAFEQADVDAIVTLHLAYSPSLESADVLAATKLPLIVLDTTPTYDFGPSQHPDEILYNHGIHGVQDMCNLLVRNGKNFRIEAGHWSESDVLDRVADNAKAAKIAKKLRNAKVGSIGKSFDGMGDFRVPADELRRAIGIDAIFVDPLDSDNVFGPVSEERVDREMESNAMRFHAGKFDRETHRQSTKADLAVRDWIERNGLTAFTANFLEVTRASALPCMPFLEASKAMERGIGYAGEGDLLTAALVGALLSVYPDTSFAEMFCPDWKNNLIFLSHMGEMNLRVAAGKPELMEKDFPFTDAGNPVVAYGKFRGGQAVYVNLAPGRNKSYSLLLSPVEMVEGDGEDRMRDTIRGWFRPVIPVADFLTAYSELGGTHHGIVVYGDAIRVLERFGAIMGWNTVTIKET